MVSNKKFREKLQKRLAEVQSDTTERKSGALAMLDAAEQAHQQGQQNAPRLLLDALEYRIREIDPDPDSWVAAKRIAIEKDASGIKSGYWGAMLFEEDARRNGCYHEDDWRMSWDIAEIVICHLDLEYA